MSLVPGGNAVLDIGARDGYYSRLLTGKYQTVTALDLVAPAIDHPRVRCVAGDVTKLEFPDDSFDGVICLEVLEHIPALEDACREIIRVARHHAIIGVPFDQDLRAGRITCNNCGREWGAWKHLHSFTEERLRDLFAPMRFQAIRYAGSDRERTNFASAALMRIARHPWGPYHLPEPCSCGAKMEPPEMTIFRRVCTGLACRIDRIQGIFVKDRPDTINILIVKV